MTECDKSENAFPIIGIGASAGGLEALQRFLDALPKEFNCALVFIQHLSSKHKSLLQGLLSARRPSLVIQEISDGLKALPGRLYLAPPGREVRLKGGFFEAMVHPEGLIHLPIDEFLASLAEDAGERAIAVIFSGAGTDGARGCQAVRTAGGTIYVQDPETAEFDGMPLAAIATGQADAVLSPEDICREILKIEATCATTAAGAEAITPEERDALFRLLLEKTGSRFHHYKKSVVSRRIRRRMYLHGLSTVREYLDLVSSRDDEAASLASDLMIGVTSFFRDRVAWKVLDIEVVRKIAAENTGHPVRIWAPASATGEEAYSITMMLSHELALAGKGRDIQVFATDVNDRALERAREGKYPSSISADVPREFVQKYFTSSDDGQSLIVTKEIRERVVMAKQDILTDPPFSRLDLIICRNFLIYLEPEAQEKCISLFHYALKDGGALFLGNAETVGRRSALFKSVGRKQCRIYRKIETTPASRLPLSVPYASERAAPQPAPSLVTAGRQAATGLVQEFLLEEYAPAAIAIDQNYDIVYHNGPTNRYLRQPRGVPTQNLLELLPKTLRNRVRGAIYRTGQEGKPVAIRANVPGDDNRKRPVTLRISRVKENLCAVVFQEKGGPAKLAEASPLEAEGIEETAIHQLESELSATRQDLQSHIEQLKSLNEELQSSNEELQAANEELETSREELQSLNEELVTVNSQLQTKIEEQDETNNDLNNFLSSTNIPTIFLDREFRVKRFTPAMLRLIKLLPSDLGRPIMDMSQENLGPDLIAAAQAVLESLVPIRKELMIGDAWYIRGVLPYRTADNRIAGVVVTYTDVCELKRAEERTRHLASFPQLNPNPVVEVDAGGKVTFVNPGAQRILETLGMDKSDVAPFLPSDLNDILRNWDGENESSRYREVTIRDRVFGETVYLTPQFKVARIYGFDITERMRAREALQRSEELFRLAVDNMPDALAIYDVERRYVFVNKAGLKRAGKPLEAVVGRRIDEMYDEEARRTFLPALMRTYETGKLQTVEATLTLPTGQYSLIVTFVPMLKDGKVHQVLGFTFDITDRKRAEAVLQREHDLLQAVMNGAKNSHLVYLDRAFNFVRVNETYAATCGYRPEAMIGKNHFALYPHAENEAIFARVRDTGEAFEVHDKPFEFPDQPERGVTYWDWTLTPVKNPAGDVEGLIFSLHETTERKKAEEALRESEARFRTLFETMTEGFSLDEIILDDAGKPVDLRYVSVNPAFERHTGLKAQDIVGKTTRELFPDAEPVWFERYGKVVLTGEPIHFEERFGPLGKWFEVSAYRTEPGRFAVVFFDITERKQAEEEIKRRVEELRAANDELARINRAMEGRELRMIELKKEVNELLRRAGDQPKYPLDFEREEL